MDSTFLFGFFGAIILIVLFVVAATISGKAASSKFSRSDSTTLYDSAL